MHHINFSMGWREAQQLGAQAVLAEDPGLVSSTELQFWGSVWYAPLAPQSPTWMYI